MKRNLIIIAISLLVVMTTTTTFAKSFTVDGIKYELSKDKTYVIVESVNKNKREEVYIPKEITVKECIYPVRGIKVGAFFECKNVVVEEYTLSNDIDQLLYENMASYGSLTVEPTPPIFYFKTMAELNNLSIPYDEGLSKRHSKSTTILLCSFFALQPYSYNHKVGYNLVFIPITKDGDPCTKITFKNLIVNKNGDPRIQDRSHYNWMDRNKMIIIENLKFTDSITAIYDCEFGACSITKSIEIPSSITYIAQNAFSGCDCSKVESIQVDNGNPTYDSRDNCNAIIDKKTKRFILSCQNTTIPKSISIIPEGIFSDRSDLTKVDIPDWITTIEANAFKRCVNLTSLTIPNSIKMIGSNAFYGCTGLESVTFDNESFIEICSSAFSDCSNLKKIKLPRLCKIHHTAFSNCPLTDIEGLTAYSPEELILPFTQTPYYKMNLASDRRKYWEQQYKQEENKKTENANSDLAALKRKIGVSVYNNLNTGRITNGMKWSSIMAYRDYINKYNYVSGAQIIDRLPGDVKVGGIRVKETSSSSYGTNYAIDFSNRKGGTISGGFIRVKNGVVTSVNLERAR